MNSTIDVTQNLHMLFLDYDIDDLDKVLESVKELQSFWNLAEAYIFKTTHGFHVLFFYDIMPYERVKMIVDYARYVDPMFKAISRFYDHKTLRASGKYELRDVHFVKTVLGNRRPTPAEVELGSMKYKEHKDLLAQWLKNSVN